MTMPLSFAKMPDGADIAYRIHKGTGPGRLALVHSLAMDHHFWDRTVGQLHAAGDILVFDCRGHGASSKSPGPYAGALFASDLDNLLTAVGWDTSVVAGASMGGSVALSFAGAYPARVAGLGLIDTTAWYGSQAPAQWEERAQKAVASGMASLIGFQKTRWFSTAFSQAYPDVVQSAVDVFLANDLGSYVETCRMLGHIDARGAMPGFRFPTRIAVGSEDFATPLAMAEAMHDAIPGSTLRVLAGAAHLTPMECPEAVADELQKIITAAYGS
jgi:3-oxoadipate enol-lactonase